MRSCRSVVSYIRTLPVLSKFVRAKLRHAIVVQRGLTALLFYSAWKSAFFFSVSETHVVEHHTALKIVIALFWVQDTVLIRRLLPTFSRKLLHRHTWHDHVNTINSEHSMTSPSLNSYIFQFVASSIE
jgi:hypothetical protein